MRRLARLAAAFVAAAAISPFALAGNAPAPGAPMSSGWRFDEQGGADLFANVCAACHQRDAEGAVGAAAYPPLVGDKRLASADFALAVIFKGLRGMPPLGGMMSDEQVADVVNYVRTHFANSYGGPVSPEQAAAARRAAAP